ncbi:hypothetical protein GCM10025859_23940 [Alicyclobacillus fastidiosus]|nr:hypothetical protein GCM10025859_23940 [Alicyclobacillus fastidiosus]
MKIALIQDAPILGDVEATLARTQQIVRTTCGENPVDLVAFPELFIAGYLPEHWSSMPTVEDERRWLERMRCLAAESQVCTS